VPGGPDFLEGSPGGAEPYGPGADLPPATSRAPAGVQALTRCSLSPAHRHEHAGGERVERADEATQITPDLYGRRSTGIRSRGRSERRLHALALPGFGHTASSLPISKLIPAAKSSEGRPKSATVTAGVVRGLRDRLPGCEVERFGMGPAVVLGQDLSEVAGPVRDGAVADLAAGDLDRKLGNGHREAAGR